MAPILSLPDELLLDIISRAPELIPAEYGESRHPRTASYAYYNKVARTCKRFLFITRPLLYDFISIRSLWMPWTGPDAWMSDGCINFHQLVRALCDVPHLRRMVRELDFGYCSSKGKMAWENCKPLKDEELVRKTLEETVGTGELYDLIFLLLQEGCQAAYMAILMILAPSAEALTMNLNNGHACRLHCERYGPNCMEKVMGVEFSTLRARTQATLKSIADHGMSNLQTCCLGDVSPFTLLNVMAIPSMREVKATLMRADEIRWIEVPELVAVSSGVTSLDLSDTAIDISWMTTIIGSCSSLKHLKYQVLESGLFEFGVESATVRQTLLEHRDTLETLRFIDSTDFGQVFGGSGFAMVGSLADFHRLTDLEIDEEALFGRAGQINYPILEFFPPGLKTLKYHTCAHVEDLLLILSVLAPLQDRELEQLILSCPVEEDPDYQEFSPLGGLNCDFFEMLDRWHPLEDRGHNIFVNLCRGPDLMQGAYRRDHLDLNFRKLETQTYPKLGEAAGMFMGFGMLQWIRVQYQLWWDREDELVFGEALLSVFDGADSLLPPEFGKLDTVFGEALMMAFEGDEVDPDLTLSAGTVHEDSWW